MTKIIIVEDDPMISEIYNKKFTDSGFEVFAVTNGEQALNVARTEKVDVVMTDLIMPKMDGFQVIESLRNGEFDPNIRIIVTSNLSQKEDRDKAIALGANGFVAKSEHSPSELVKEIQRLMGQFQEQQKNESRATALAESSNVQNDADKKKILIIEDEEIFIEMFGEKLRQDGFAVESATNGAWGVKEALRDKFDLFVIDMIMPAMTGEEMITKLKMEDQTKNIPIIVLSASVEGDVIKRVKEMGIESFFIKTQITPNELSKEVSRILNK
ncbi:MAG: response regulator [Candidatus Moranbacteria bacterium]|nr:response regulator [Candidatus Moranbacteria bacterium]